MLCECNFSVGDIVEYRSWYNGEGGWVSINGMIGVVLEIIEITGNDNGFVFIAQDDALYDIKVYWYTEGFSEIIPDMLLDHYTVDSRIEF